MRNGRWPCGANMGPWIGGDSHGRSNPETDARDQEHLPVRRGRRGRAGAKHLHSEDGHARRRAAVVGTSVDSQEPLQRKFDRAHGKYVAVNRPSCSQGGPYIAAKARQTRQAGLPLPRRLSAAIGVAEGRVGVDVGRPGPAAGHDGPQSMAMAKGHRRHLAALLELASELSLCHLLTDR